MIGLGMCAAFVIGQAVAQNSPAGIYDDELQNMLYEMRGMRQEMETIRRDGLKMKVKSDGPLEVKIAK